MRKITKQSGFTLIELMIVVVIVGIVAGIGVMSLGANDGAKSRQTAKQVQGLLQSAYDQASFKQQVVLVYPDESSEPVTLRSLVWNNAWNKNEHLNDLPLAEGFQYRWEMPESSQASFPIPTKGWLFWPSGETTAGSLIWQAEVGKFKQESILSWTAAMKFDFYGAQD